MFKVLNEGMVIDIIEKPIYVKYYHRGGVLMPTIEPHAGGVVSSDGLIIYHLKNKPMEGFVDQISTTLVRISDEEAEELRAILETNEQELIEQLQEELGVDEVPEEQILPRAPLMELQVMVQVLVDRVDKLEDENSRLKEIIETETASLRYAP